MERSVFALIALGSAVVVCALLNLIEFGRPD
jgi:hypothetical protein